MQIFYCNNCRKVSGCAEDGYITECVNCHINCTLKDYVFSDLVLDERVEEIIFVSCQEH